MQIALQLSRKEKKILEIGVEGNSIVDFQTGDMTSDDIMEMYADDTQK